MQAIIGAYIVFVFMRSRARVRFSKTCLVSAVPQETDPHIGAGLAENSVTTPEVLMLNFRLVRESYTQVRDAHIHVQARYMSPYETSDECRPCVSDTAAGTGVPRGTRHAPRGTRHVPRGTRHAPRATPHCSWHYLQSCAPPSLSILPLTCFYPALLQP